MLTISNIAGGGSGYYIGKDEKLGNYYLEGSSRTFWGGGAKDALGLGDGTIKSEEFDRLMLGQHPTKELSEQSQQSTKRKHDPGRDLTFSDPKSVSILMQGPLREDILKIRRKAVETAMAYGEKHFAKTRIKGQIVGDQKTTTD